MGIQAKFTQGGVTSPPLYFRVACVALANKSTWTAFAWGFADRASSIRSLSPIWMFQFSAPYAKNVDPHTSLYAALHAYPSLSDATDVLFDPPVDGQTNPNEPQFEPH